MKKQFLGVCLLNSVSNRNWMANSYLLLHFPSWIRTIFKRRRAQMCLRCACHSPPLSRCILTSKQLCWDNSYYCLLFFMIGFHIQYDLLITVLRTSKGHLPHPISITVKEHQSQQQKKERKKGRKKISLHPWLLEVAHGWRPTWVCVEWRGLQRPTGTYWPMPAHLNEQMSSSFLLMLHIVTIKVMVHPDMNVFLGMINVMADNR